ncbi:MAG: hypothetical protein M3Y54_18385, partial [Bacteroidota bacterium]|nr:hypothetical protein [Bacteroidota bacterium]
YLKPEYLATQRTNGYQLSQAKKLSDCQKQQKNSAISYSGTSLLIHMTQNISQSATANIELQESIEQLYRIFLKYPINLNMEGSPYYPELPKWNQALAAKTLRELSAEDLEVYHFKAMTTWGNVNDFKHFLPRIFGLLADLPIEFDEWVALGKLNYGNYKNWPDEEKKAVLRFLLAFWQKLLAEKSDIIDAYFGGYFPAIANVYPDFSQLLQLWLANDNQSSSRRLAEFICDYEKQILKKRLSLYEEMMPEGKQFYEWLRGKPVLEKIKQAVPSESHPYLDLELIPIIEQLERPL